MSKAIEGADYFVRVIDMPHQIHGCVAEDGDGFYSVYINARDSFYRQAQAYRHEMKHIQRDDFRKASVIEAEEP